MNTTANKGIIEGIISGDHQILKSFYKRNLPIVRKVILQYQGTTEDVEDIFQEALIILYGKLRIDSTEITEYIIHNYFIGICKNLWRNQWRKVSTTISQEICFHTIIDESESIIDLLTQQNKEQVFHKHLQKLNLNSRQILKSFMEGISMRDISNTMEYTEGYTRKKKHLIKEHLTKMVQNDPTYKELMAG